MATLIKHTGNGNVGLLDQNEFNFTVLTSSNSSKNPLPLQIKLSGHCFGKNLNIILNQVTDIRSLIKSKVWQVAGLNITQPNLTRIVTILIYS